MPSRTPFSFTPSSSSTSSSASSSFIPYSNFSFNTNVNPAGAGTTHMGGLADLGRLPGMGDNRSQSLGSSLSSSRDEHEHVSYTPIYPSYSSSFSNSSLELHESLLMAIRERQQQQLLQHQLQQQQQLYQQQQQQQQRPSQADSHAIRTSDSIAIAGDFHHIPLDHSTDVSEMVDQDDDADQYRSLLQRGLQEGEEDLPQQEANTLTAILLEQSRETMVGPLPNSPMRSDIGGIVGNGGIGHNVLEIRQIDESSQTTAISIHANIPVADSSATDGAADVNQRPSSSSLVLSLGTLRDASSPDLNRDRIHSTEREMALHQDGGTHVSGGPWLPRRSPLLLAQSLVINDDQSLQQFDPADPIFAPLRPPQTPSPLDLEQGGRNHSHDHHRTPHIYSIHDGGGDEGINRVLDRAPPHPYPTTNFHSLDSQQAYSNDTRLALSQVLTSFQEAVLDQSLDGASFPMQGVNRSLSADSGERAGDISTGMSTVSTMQPPMSAPDLEFSLSQQATRETPTISRDDLELSVNDFVPLPRRPLMRRRYTTRDYSSGTISSDNWLHHPDVVAFTNAENAPSVSSSQRDFESGPDISIGFEPAPVVSTTETAETPHTPEEGQEGHTRNRQIRQARNFDSAPPNLHQIRQDDDVRQIMETLSLAPTSPTTLQTAVTSVQPITTADEEAQASVSMAAPIAEESATATTEPGSESSVDVSRADRLGLLGPLLSSTRTASTTTSEDTLEFSLLGSTRPGFDSSILSMASRIRQARLSRLIRLMGARETSVGYPERYPWNRLSQTDTRSMINHTGGSRGTSRAGSLEDGLMDLGPETDTFDAAEESGRAFMRNRDQIPPLPLSGSSQLYPAQHPTFAEILDCNGNSIDWSSSDSYTSSSASSIASHETIEEQDEDLDWMSLQAAEQQRQRCRRRAQLERLRWEYGIINGHGRSRVVSTGTVFEGMEHISEADGFLTDNHRYQSLKSSWATNPNGESWSDDDENGPQRRRPGGADVDDKDQETVLIRRGQPSLGVLQPGAQNQQPTNIGLGGSGSRAPGDGGAGLYYIYGNVRNRYGPENVRRRRVMSEMTDLLRREQEWGRGLEQYEREMTASRRPTRIVGVRRLPIDMDMWPRSVGSTNDQGFEMRSTQGIGSRSSIPSSRVGDIARQPTGANTAVSVSSGGEQNGVLPGRAEGFRDYELGNSHYHAQDVVAHGQQTTHSSLMDRLHQQQAHTETQSEIIQPVHHHNQPMSRQPTVALMNRTPPLLPVQPQLNEPIAHQIRRVHTSHMVNLHRRWDEQQQAQQQQRHQRRSNVNNTTYQNGSSVELSDQLLQRHPGNLFVPPPPQQEPYNHTYSSQIPGFLQTSTGTMPGLPPFSRGNRSSFRTSHETNGFQHFQLSGNPPLHAPSAAPSLTLDDRVSVTASSTATTVTSSSAAVTSPSSIPLSTSSLTPSAVSSTSTATETPNQPSSHQGQSYWRARLRGSNSLYVNYEGGVLKPEERWRRGDEEMVGR